MRAFTADDKDWVWLATGEAYHSEDPRRFRLTFVEIEDSITFEEVLRRDLKVSWRRSWLALRVKACTCPD